MTLSGYQEGTRIASSWWKVGDDGDETANYAIWTKTAAELAVDDEGKALDDGRLNPIKPIDYDAPRSAATRSTSR